MPKKVCNLLNSVLVCLLAAVMSPVLSPNSPSFKEALPLLSAPKINLSNPPVNTNQNSKTSSQDISLNGKHISSAAEHDQVIPVAKAAFKCTNLLSFLGE
jgi:hypothetical protein